MQWSLSETRRLRSMRAVMMTVAIGICASLGSPDALTSASSRTLPPVEIDGLKAALADERPACHEHVVFKRPGMGFLIN